MDPIKESFNRVKEDMDFLKIEVNQIRESIIELCDIIEKMSKKEQKTEQIQDISNPAHNSEIPANQHIIPAHNIPFKPLNTQKQPFSTGNEGVPADRQTNQQTDRYIEEAGKYVSESSPNPFEISRYSSNIQEKPQNSIENAAEMLKSLDNIKKDIRQKFKKLTDQEWLVFSTIYQLDEEVGSSDYRLIAERLHLTESSIRDYVARLIKKGIPVDKTKLNNKNIQLNISQNLKRIASLPTIITLREL